MVAEVDREKMRDAFDAVAERMVAAASEASKMLGAEQSYDARDWISSAMRDAFDHPATKTAMLLALRDAVEAKPEVVIGHLFQSSGRLIESKTSTLIDQMVTEAITADDRFKPWIEEYVKANMERFVLSAIAKVLLAHMTGTLSRISNDAAQGADFMIGEAFRNASLQRRGY